MLQRPCHQHPRPGRSSIGTNAWICLRGRPWIPVLFEQFLPEAPPKPESETDSNHLFPVRQRRRAIALAFETVSAKIAAAGPAGLGRTGVPGQTRQFASQNLLIASAVTWGDSPVLN